MHKYCPLVRIKDKGVIFMVIKNIRSLIKNETALFLVMALIVFSSALLLYFSYGLYQNFNVKLSEADTEYLELTLEVNKGRVFTKGELLSFIEALKTHTADNVEIFLVTADAGSISSHRKVSDEIKDQIEAEYGNIIMTDDKGNEITFSADTDLTVWDGAVFYFRFRYSDGEFKYIELSESELSDGRMLTSGRLFTDEEYSTGAKVAIGRSGAGQTTSKYLYEGDKVWLWNEEYEIIGSAGSSFMPTPPITAVPDSLELDPYLTMYFHKSLTSSQYKDIRDTAESVVPGMFVFKDISFPDSESRYVYSNIILISVFIAIMSAVNFVMLYRCILVRRSKTLAIFRICGCSKARAVFNYICECVIISVPVFLIGLFVYIPVMKHWLSGVFPYMKAAYSLSIYTGIFLIYFAVMLLTLSLMMIRTISGSITDTIKNRR